MKRREFVKGIGVGLSGLVGLERLMRALSGDPAYAQTRCYVDYSCDSSLVKCGYDRAYGYGFTCEGGYDCTTNFKCNDFACIDTSERDGFGCKGASFRCPGGSQSGQRFDCHGVDYTHNQFYCRTNFYCEPHGRFGCDDFYCEEGNYFCSATVGTLSVSYAVSIVPLEL